MDAVWRRILGHFSLHINDYPIETGQRADPRTANGIYGGGDLGAGLYRFYTPAAGRRTFRLGRHLKILAHRLSDLRRLRALCYAQNAWPGTYEIIRLIALKERLIQIVIKICAIVISTGGPQSGPKWRNLFKQISLRGSPIRFVSRLRCALPRGHLTVEMTQTSTFIIYN